MSDSIMGQIRKTRDAYAAGFNYDLDAMFADLRKREGKSGHKVVSRVVKRKSRKRD